VRDTEVSFTARTGQARTVHGSVELLELDGRPCLLAIIMDVTDRKQVEAAVQVSLTKYTALFEAAPVGISIIDAEGTIVETNRWSLPASAPCGHTSGSRMWRWVWCAAPMTLRG
jgi:PAS domain-containing protein